MENEPMRAVTTLRMECKTEGAPPEIIQLWHRGCLEEAALGRFVGAFLAQCAYRPNNCLCLVLEGIIEEFELHHLENEGGSFGPYSELRKAIKRAYDADETYERGEAFEGEVAELLKALPAATGDVDE